MRAITGLPNTTYDPLTQPSNCVTPSSTQKQLFGQLFGPGVCVKVCVIHLLVTVLAVYLGTAAGRRALPGSLHHVGLSQSFVPTPPKFRFVISSIERSNFAKLLREIKFRSPFAIEYDSEKLFKIFRTPRGELGRASAHGCEASAAYGLSLQWFSSCSPWPLQPPLLLNTESPP